MIIAIIGSGGREHAICEKINLSKKVKKIFCLPGNGGTNKVAENVAIDINNFEELKKFLIKNNVDLTIIGPEEPLVNGIVDYLSQFGLKVFGPDKFCSKLEGSKIFTKKICKEENIPTADFKILNKKTEVAFNEFKKFSKKEKNVFVVAGGVAANQSIRKSLDQLSKKNNFEPIFSDLKFCGDNAAMIAWAGIQRYKKKLIDNLNVEPKSRWPLDKFAPYMKGPGLKL